MPRHVAPQVDVHFRALHVRDLQIDFDQCHIFVTLFTSITVFFGIPRIPHI